MIAKGFDAQLYRGRGALAFESDTYEALSHYQRATELEPDNVDGWNQLGHLQDQLGNIYKTQGELDKVREAWQQSVALFQQVGMPHMVEQVQGWINGLDGAK